MSLDVLIFKYTKKVKNNMELQTKRILSEIEEIKSKVISLEISIIGLEKASKEDIKSTKLAIKEYRNKKAIPFSY